MRLRKVLKADTATVLLPTEGGQKLLVPASVGLEEEVRRHVTVPVGEGVAGRIAATWKPLIVEDLSQEEVVGPILGRQVRSLLGVPLLLEDRLIGVLHVGTKKARHFTEDDRRLLELVAERAASAIERARTQEHQAHLAAIVESSQDAIIDMEAHGRVTGWNPGAEKLYGYSREEMRGKPASILAPRERRDEVESLAERIQGGEHYGPEETVHRRKDGVLVEVSLTGFPVREATGRVVGIAIIARDITAHKIAERALQENEKRFRQLADSMPQLVWTANPDGTVDYYNERHKEFSGIGPEPGGGWEWAPVLHPEDRQATVEAWHHALRTGATYQITHRVLRAEGSYHGYLSRGVPVRDQQARIIKWYGTATDIDDVKRLEEERERLLEQREDLVRTVSHDLRTPLTAILGQAQIIEKLLARTGQDDSLQRSISAIVTGGRRMNAMIQDLVDMARVESGQMTLEMVPTDLAAFAIDLKARLATVLDPARLWVEAAEGQAIALADHDRLERVLTNLLSNPLKYSERPVTVRVERAEGQRKERLSAAIIVPLCTKERVYGVFASLGSTPVSFSLEDLTFGRLIAERLGIALENAELIRQLRAAVQARDEFVSIATHELKTPVTVLKGYAQALLARSGGLGEPERRALAAPSQHSERLAG